MGAPDLRVIDGGDAVKIPPTDLDAEAAVLCSLLVDPASVGIVRDMLKPEHCFSEAHRRILEAIYAVADQGKEIDAVTVGSHLKGSGRIGQVGGMEYVTRLLDTAPRVQHVRTYTEIVFERWRCRQVIMAAERIAARGWVDRPNDVQSYVEDAATTMQALARMQPGKKHETNLEVLTRMLKRQQGTTTTGKKNLKETGIPTGFPEIDERIGGLHSGHKITIGALSGCGKTTIALQIGRYVADQGIGVMIFSAEQEHEECLVKLLSAAISAPYMAIKKENLSADKWTALYAETDRLGKLPLWIRYCPNARVSEIASQAMHQAEMTGPKVPPLGLIIVDHLHCLAPPVGLESANEYQQVDRNSQDLKLLAQKLGIPLIELAQQKALGPNEKIPGNKSICLSAGKVRQSADALLYLHCPDPEKEPSMIQAIFNKCRWAKPGTVDLRLQGDYSRFAGGGREFY